MEKVLTLMFISIFVFSFIFIIGLPLVGLYVGLRGKILDEKKYGLEGAQHLRGHGGRGY
jgi:ABC-type transport system involved in cytochrome bd biosynthesis fused ATPase/permease subunit